MPSFIWSVAAAMQRWSPTLRAGSDTDDWSCGATPSRIWRAFLRGRSGARWRILDPATPVLLAFGDLPERRAARARLAGYAPALVDPSAIIGGGVKIGPGTVVMPGCVINAWAEVAEDAIVNTGAIVEHDCVVGRNAHLSPGVRLAGAATVGEDAHVGAGGIVLPGIRIGSGAVVGAGAVVIRDVAPDTTVAGIPARPLRP